MYVCICKGVTEKDIHQAVAEGVSNLEELSAKTSVSKYCGCCTEYANQIIEEAKIRRS